MHDLYRFENGHLYILQGDAYVHCYHSARALTLAQAIRAYNFENELLGFGG